MEVGGPRDCNSNHIPRQKNTWVTSTTHNPAMSPQRQAEGISGLGNNPEEQGGSGLQATAPWDPTMRHPTPWKQVLPA